MQKVASANNCCRVLELLSTSEMVRLGEIYPVQLPYWFLILQVLDFVILAR